MLVTVDESDVVALEETEVVTVELTDVVAEEVAEVVAEEVAVLDADVVAVEDIVVVWVLVIVLCSHFMNEPSRYPSMAAFIKSTVSVHVFRPAVTKPSIVHDALPLFVFPYSSWNRASPTMWLIAADIALHPAPSPPS